MKIKIFILLLGVLAITACEPRNVQFSAGERDIYTDVQTGCQYIKLNSRLIVPRYSADGRTVQGCGTK